MGHEKQEKEERKRAKGGEERREANKRKKKWGGEKRTSTVYLYDIGGRQIATKIIDQNQITLDRSFNSGIYFLKIEGQKGGVKFMWQN